MSKNKSFNISRLQIGYWEHYRLYGRFILEDGILYGLGMFYIIIWNNRNIYS